MTDYGSCAGGSYTTTQACVNNQSCGYYFTTSCSPTYCGGTVQGYVCDCPYFPAAGFTSPYPGYNANPWSPMPIPSGCTKIDDTIGVNMRTGATCYPTIEYGGSSDCWPTSEQFYCQN
jgi:hypothetical protein